jgi:glucose/arabinose dehydrogenase
MEVRLSRFVLLAIAGVFAFGCGSAGAASLRPIGDFDQPVYVTSSPANPERLLIVEREGKILETGPAGTRQLFDLTELVSCCDVERGMLSIAPAPDFESSGRIYATYAGTPLAGGAEGDVHLDSFRPNPAAGAPIREPILSVGHAQEANHNGGQLQFGPDGHLYMSLGDGGGTGDPFENGQGTDELLGKILRVDPHPGQTPAYSIPAGNPFAGAVADEIWAYGLRNPWRFSFDRATGDMVIADVGQSAREEIDIATSPAAGVVGGAGANYGWNGGMCNRERIHRAGLRLPACRPWRRRRLRLFDHRWLRRARREPWRPLWPLPLHRLLLGRDSLAGLAPQRRSRQ